MPENQKVKNVFSYIKCTYGVKGKMRWEGEGVRNPASCPMLPPRTIPYGREMTPEQTVKYLSCELSVHQ